ncbi:MAG TPA: RHS repeat-associated core domain-containing protein [Pyrinomonadaceae bacterium]|nr:RHS repeat-associated core domain-containing protein [Pyrinomonadaceae bacterium]
MGRTTETRQYESSSTYITVRTEYDVLGRAYRTSKPFRTSTPVWTETAFDALGRVHTVTTPDGAFMTTDYSGNTVTVTDQALKKRQSVTDGLGRLTQVFEDPTGVNYQTTYDYDALDDLTTVTQGVQTRTFAYDSLKRLTSATNPESGTIGYQYDGNGNLTQKTDARGVITTYIYDTLNRLTSRSYSDSTPTVTYTYDATGVANSKGRLTAVGSTVSSYAFTSYDALGRVLGATQTTDSIGYSMSYSYDFAGDLKSQTYPSGRVVSSEYDGAGRLAGVKNYATSNYYAGAASSDSANRLQYTPHGAISKLRLGNGLWEHTDFNSRLQPTQIGLGSASTNSSVLQLDYSYGSTNNNGNVQSQTITVPTIGPVAGFTATQVYTYDNLNRLATAQENTGSSWSQNFTYDRYGNRNFTTGTTVPSPVTAANNPIISASNNRIDNTVSGQTSVLYDFAGNLTRDVSGHRFVYDGENKQTTYDGGATSGGATYYYDADGRRVKTVVGSTALTTVFVYNIQGQLVAEYSSAGPSGTPGISYLTTDTLGTPRVITGSGQEVKSRHDYLPFGEELFTDIGPRTNAQGYSAADGIRQQFTQKERDMETGLDYFLARYYSSIQGRFTSVDPANYQAQLNPDEPQSWNAYSYVNNNPLVRTDPNGRGIGDFFKKLKNRLIWGVWGDDAAVKKEEERRRADLLRNADKDGGIIICSPTTGQYVRVFPNQMNRANVWLWSDAIYYWNQHGGGYHQLTPDQLASVIDITAYRGGPNIEVRDIDVKIKDGMVQPTRGPSVNLDPSKVEKFGGAYRIESLPDELQLIQRGASPSHYEIVPKNPMPLERFIELVKQVKLVPK